MKITQGKLAGLPDGMHSDDNCTGLYVRVRGSSRSFVFRRKAGGKKFEAGLGGVAKVSLRDARKKAAELRGLTPEELEARLKPKAEERKAATFADAAEAFRLWNLEKGKWAEGEMSETVPARRLRNHILPVIGGIPLSELRCADVARVADRLWDRRETMSRCLWLVRQIFDWAKAKDWVAGDNPASTDGPLQYLLPGSRPEARNQGALPVRRLPAFVAALEELGTQGARCFVFSILTATRSANARGARWEDIDLEAGEWRISREEMKVAGNGDLVVPLAGRVVEWLKALGPEEEGLLFESRSGGEFSDAVFAAIIKRLNSGNPEPWIDEEQTERLGRTVRATQHGVARSTFRTWAQDDELGNDRRFDSRVAELCLHHKLDDKYNGAYERNRFDRRRREMMEAWADYCFSLLPPRS